MHHGTCVTHVPWCMPGSLTSGFLWSRWRLGRGKRSRHSRRMRNPQFYVSGKSLIWKSLRLSTPYRWFSARLLTHWGYCSRSLSRWYIVFFLICDTVALHVWTMLLTMPYVEHAHWIMQAVSVPDSKVHGANMGPPGSYRPVMGPMLAPWT